MLLTAAAAAAPVRIPDVVKAEPASKPPPAAVSPSPAAVGTPASPNPAVPSWFGMEFREKLTTRDTRNIVLNVDFAGTTPPMLFDTVYRRGRLTDAGALEISAWDPRNRGAMIALRDAITGSGIDALQNRTYYRPRTDGPKVNVQLGYGDRPQGDRFRQHDATVAIAPEPIRQVLEATQRYVDTVTRGRFAFSESAAAP